MRESSTKMKNSTLKLMCGHLNVPQILNPKPLESRLLGPPLLFGGRLVGAALLWPPVLGPPCCGHFCWGRHVVQAALYLRPPFLLGRRPYWRQRGFVAAALLEAAFLLLRLPW